MKLTKYEHACFTIESDGELIVVDPGNYSTDFIAPSGVVAIVITHEHADHFDRDHVAAIMNENPGAVIISNESVTKQIDVFETKTVAAGDVVEISDFRLEFFGGKHALIHDTIPIINNLGVFINETVYYPGDSFTLTNRPIDVLALPVGAPWLKIGEVIDFLNATKPLLAFPTHDAVLSDTGKNLADNMILKVSEANEIAYKRIDGTTIEV
jgi:L-ascorbate metabolism protein UlaG (beta-lactamase superfamily)